MPKLLLQLFVLIPLLALQTTAPAPSSIARRMPPPSGKPPVARPSRGATDLWIVPAKDIPPLMRLFTFQSDIINKPVSYTIYLPPDYFKNPKMRYPVLYMLPAVSGDCREFARQVDVLDQSIKKGTLPPMIAVGVQAVYASFYVDAKDGRRPIESIIAKELVERIDKVYQTIPDREHRGLEGFSMGAWGAARLAFKYPDLFGNVSMISPPAGSYEFFAREFPDFTKDIWENDTAMFNETDPFTIVGQNADKIRGRMNIRLYGGDADRFFVTIEDFHKRLDELNIKHEWRVVPKAPHSLNAMYNGVRDRLFEFWKQSFGPPYVPKADEEPTTRP